MKMMSQCGGLMKYRQRRIWEINRDKNLLKIHHPHPPENRTPLTFEPMAPC
jgi:hypothetical protein